MTDEAERQARERVGCVLDDKWTLEGLLGVGGMAAVYAATHRNGARAAVKVLHSEFSRHKEVRERFLREGYAANSVEHAGAVKVLDDDVVGSGPEAGTAYIVMELLEGVSLQDRLEAPPPMGELEFLAIASSVLDVLEAAHARGVVHRDLKPENLFLVRAGDDAGASVGVKVKVLDFGLARLIQGQAITSYGLALGTPSFMSPEQAAGRIDEIDGRTDLFALAATGFRICTGRRIHEAPNAIDLVRKMATLAAPKTRTVRADVSEACARVIDRALEFRREDRYENAAAMREDVRRAVEELEIRGPTQLAVLPAPVSMPAPVAAPVSMRAPLPAPLSVPVPQAAPVPVSAPPGAAGFPVSSNAPARPKVASGDQTTIELSESDLRQPWQPAVEESIRIPRQRSTLPGLAWLALAVAAGIGAVAWHRHRVSAEAAEAARIAAELPPVVAEPVVVPTVATVASATAPLVVRDRDADAPLKAAASASAIASATPPKSSPPTSATHHSSSPGKAGTVHKGKKHHAAKSAKPTPTPAQ